MGHILRGLMGSSAMGLGFLALGLLPLPEVVAIGYTAPFMVTILAAISLGERIHIVRFSTLLLGLSGVFLVILPRLSSLDAATASSLESIGFLAALMAAFFWRWLSCSRESLLQRRALALSHFIFPACHACCRC